MGNMSDFFSAVHPELQEAKDDFTALLFGAERLGIKRLNHSITGHYDAQHPLPGLRR